jgi:hypothetical protein
MGFHPFHHGNHRLAGKIRRSGTYPGMIRVSASGFSEKKKFREYWKSRPFYGNSSSPSPVSAQPTFSDPFLSAGTSMSSLWLERD